VKCESNTLIEDTTLLQSTVTDILKLKAEVIMVQSGELPRDGVIISDLRPVLD